MSSSLERQPRRTSIAFRADRPSEAVPARCRRLIIVRHFFSIPNTISSSFFASSAWKFGQPLQRTLEIWQACMPLFDNADVGCSSSGFCGVLKCSTGDEDQYRHTNASVLPALLAVTPPFCRAGKWQYPSSRISSCGRLSALAPQGLRHSGLLAGDNALGEVWRLRRSAKRGLTEVEERARHKKRRLESSQGGLLRPERCGGRM